MWSRMTSGKEEIRKDTTWMNGGGEGEVEGADKAEKRMSDTGGREICETNNYCLYCMS